MNQLTVAFLLLWTSGPTLVSAQAAAATTKAVTTKAVTTVKPSTAAPVKTTVQPAPTVCGVPATAPTVPTCPSSLRFFGIVSGAEAKAQSWPWQVSFQTTAGLHFCGGSLINANWVVTAAHCNINSAHLVKLGLHDRKVTTGATAQNLKIGKVVNHPSYSRTTLDYDIALIKLATPAKITAQVSPVCVPQSTDIFYAGMQCVTTGWGGTQYQQAEKPLKLQQGCLPLIGYTSCRATWGTFVTPRMICAGATRSQICQGDAGGPLVCQKNGAWTLVGVTSWVQTGCVATTPSGFTRITALRPWIDTTMAWN